MNLGYKLLAAATVIFSAQSQAAVDVTGFTIEAGGSPPYGLIMAVLLLLAIGFASLRRA